MKTLISKYKMSKNKYIAMFVGAIILFGFVATMPVLAATKNKGGDKNVRPNVEKLQDANGAPVLGKTGKVKPMVFGTVSSVSGNTITVSTKIMGGFASSTFAVKGKKHKTSTSTPVTIFTVDATNATVMKAGATSTVSAVAVGDTVVVQGTLSGTNITATLIRDGMMKVPGMMGGDRNGQGNPANQVQGNGQPVVEGTVSSISGSTLNITNKSNVQYAVDATNARIVKGNATSSISDIAVGDILVVQGPVNGSAITASLVLDQSNPVMKVAPNNQGKKVGFFGKVGSFLSHLFGF